MNTAFSCAPPQSRARGDGSTDVLFPPEEAQPGAGGGREPLEGCITELAAAE